ncbi:unnamed protein product [Durusdinium trenchii]|uniref:Holocytochrome c-type synthase n=1 Tax=Durusdinium trenchii TaxID=1381693 RepID=A0ABP0KIU6_9DINO
MTTGRGAPDIRESILWTQRIEKEDKVNATSMAAFSLRAAVSVEDVPAKFKPGHVNPAGGLSKEKGFDPAKHGWDPDGPEAREFRRCIAMQSAGSRQRYPYPETSYQEHGWLLLPPGDAVARTFKKKLRRGIGWEWKDPCDWSESNPAAPIIPKEAPEGAEATSCVSAAPPSVLSVLTSIPESQILALQNGSGVKTKAAQVAATAAPAKKPSILSASAPNILAPRFGIPSSASELSASTVSKASSTDAILDPAERLRRREVKLAERLKDAWAYQNGGCKGQKWYHPLGQTDATRFADEFTKATGGVPLYKMGKI